MLSPRSWSEETAHSDSVSPRTLETQRRCIEYSRKHHCAEFFAEYPQVREYGLDCTKIAPVGRSGAACDAGGLQAGKEFVEFVAGLVPAMWNWSSISPDRKLQLKFYAECAKEMECKENLWRAVHGSDPSPEVRARLEQIDRAETLEFGIEQGVRNKRMEMSSKARDILLNEQDSPDRDAKLEALLPGWTERKNKQADSIKSIGLAAAAGPFKNPKCFDPKITQEIGCYGVLATFTPGFGPAKALANLPRARAALEALNAGKAATRGAQTASHGRSVATAGRKYYDNSEHINFHGINSRQVEDLEDALQSATKHGQGHAQHLHETPDGLAKLGHWPKHDFETVAKQFFRDVPPERLRIQRSSFEGSPGSKVQFIDSKNPARMIEVDPASGYFRIFENGKSQIVLRLSNGTYVFQPSRNLDLVHILLAPR